MYNPLCDDIQTLQNSLQTGDDAMSSLKVSSAEHGIYYIISMHADMPWDAWQPDAMRLSMASREDHFDITKYVGTRFASTLAVLPKLMVCTCPGCHEDLALELDQHPFQLGSLGILQSLQRASDADNRHCWSINLLDTEPQPGEGININTKRTIKPDVDFHPTGIRSGQQTWVVN